MLTFQEMWKDQEGFIRLLQEKRNFPQCPVDISSKSGQKILKDIMHHCMDELFESSQHLRNHKSHRITELPEVDHDAYVGELVDATKLLIELIIMSGITLEQFCDAYEKKSQENVKRINGAY